jgi:protein-tyrosine-phosphatase
MKILFVCTANICRSVMAEALMKHMLLGHGNPIDVESAGVNAIGNLETDRFTKQVCSEHGLDISSHRSKQLTEEMLDHSNVVLCLAEIHKHLILRAYPRFKSKVFLLKQFRRKYSVQQPSVDDPIGRPFSHYEHCYSEIEKEVKRIASLLVEEEKVSKAHRRST